MKIIVISLSLTDWDDQLSTDDQLNLWSLWASYIISQKIIPKAPGQLRWAHGPQAQQREEKRCVPKKHTFCNFLNLIKIQLYTWCSKSFRHSWLLVLIRIPRCSDEATMMASTYTRHACPWKNKFWQANLPPLHPGDGWSNNVHIYSHCFR